ncbi:MAG: hypothetical protein LBM67_08325 [Lentimicrobiaceae bacterium]|jgi:hypothetical protein|nr:hypothetical protein [Lentimicrobiaceae bacterium]
MKFKDEYKYVVAIIERSVGNSSIGDMFLETSIFPRDTKIDEIIKWAEESNCSGKLIITIPDQDYFD